MRITSEDKRKIAAIRKQLEEKGDFEEMKAYMQHGRVSTYEHVCKVAALCCMISAGLKLTLDEESLLKGALLHDFYLYDWHNNKPGTLHGFHHSEIAKKNAVEQYNIDEKTQNIIESHMWPLTLDKLPQSREAVLVCLADKIVSVQETLFNR